MDTKFASAAGAAIILEQWGHLAPGSTDEHVNQRLAEIQESGQPFTLGSTLLNVFQLSYEGDGLWKYSELRAGI